MVREARKKGLRAPILFMGYYNPMLSYGEERLLKDCREAGVNGFIVVDLPPEEAISFRNFCMKGGWVRNLLPISFVLMALSVSHMFLSSHPRPRLLDLSSFASLLTLSYMLFHGWVLQVLQAQ